MPCTKCCMTCKTASYLKSDNRSKIFCTKFEEHKELSFLCGFWIQRDGKN